MRSVPKIQSSALEAQLGGSKLILLNSLPIQQFVNRIFSLLELGFVNTFGAFTRFFSFCCTSWGNNAGRVSFV